MSTTHLKNPLNRTGMTYQEALEAEVKELRSLCSDLMCFMPHVSSDLKDTNDYEYAIDLAKKLLGDVK